MKHIIPAIILAFFASASAWAAGIREIQVPSGADGPAIRALLWTPCALPPAEVKLFGGRVVLPGISDCPILGDKLPIIVISHGLGGEFLGHQDTAETLADGGFITVALNHPLDSAFDMTHANEAIALLERPIDVKRLIDYMLQSSPAATKLDPNRIGFFGFSRGGYTGLVLAGAVPELPDASRDHALANDPRIRAFVIADPLTQSFFPSKDNLRKVTAPLQIWSSQNGGQGVTPEKVASVANDLPARPEFHPVPNSTHLSFITPCSPEMAKVAGDACVDPPGFDRAAFHKQFDAAVLAFFRKSLSK